MNFRVAHGQSRETSGRGQKLNDIQWLDWNPPTGATATKVYLWICSSRRHWSFVGGTFFVQWINWRFPPHCFILFVGEKLLSGSISLYIHRKSPKLLKGLEGNAWPNLGGSPFLSKFPGVESVDAAGILLEWNFKLWAVCKTIIRHAAIFLLQGNWLQNPRGQLVELKPLTTSCFVMINYQTVALFWIDHTLSLYPVMKTMGILFKTTLPLFGFFGTQVRGIKMLDLDISR